MEILKRIRGTTCILFFIFAILIQLITANSTLADKTRGLRITAKDTASGQQKELKNF